MRVHLRTKRHHFRFRHLLLHFTFMTDIIDPSFDKPPATGKNQYDANSQEPPGLPEGWKYDKFKTGDIAPLPVPSFGPYFKTIVARLEICIGNSVLIVRLCPLSV